MLSLGRKEFLKSSFSFVFTGWGRLLVFFRSWISKLCVLSHLWELISLDRNEEQMSETQLSEVLFFFLVPPRTPSDSCIGSDWSKSWKTCGYKAEMMNATTNLIMLWMMLCLTVALGEINSFWFMLNNVCLDYTYYLVPHFPYSPVYPPSIILSSVYIHK